MERSEIKLHTSKCIMSQKTTLLWLARTSTYDFDHFWQECYQESRQSNDLFFHVTYKYCFCTTWQGCSPRDRGLGLESTRDQFYMVLALVLRGKVFVLILMVSLKDRSRVDKFQDQLCTAPVRCTMQSYLELASSLPNANVKNILCNEQFKFLRHFELDVLRPATSVPVESLAEQGMGRWVMGRENGMGHMGHGSLGDDP